LHYYLCSDETKNHRKGDDMKKYLLIICALYLAVISYASAIGFEGAGGYVLEENHNYFFVNGSALINIKNNFYARTQLVHLGFHSGSTLISIGTMSPLDLMLFFPQSTFNPYGLAGINLTTGGGSTIFNLRAGAGVEFKFNEANFFPFVEADLDLMSISSGTYNAITIKGGVRIK
jgi:hypothetical protein